MLSRRGRQTMKPPTPTPPCSAPTPATAPPSIKHLAPPAASLVQSSGPAHACSSSLATAPAPFLLSPLDLPLTVAHTPPQSVPHPRFYVLILLFLFSLLLLLLWLLTSERFIYSFVAQLKLRMYVRVCVCVRVVSLCQLNKGSLTRPGLCVLLCVACVACLSHMLRHPPPHATCLPPLTSHCQPSSTYLILTTLVKRCILSGDTRSSPRRIHCCCCCFRCCCWLCYHPKFAYKVQTGGGQRDSKAIEPI